MDDAPQPAAGAAPRPAGGPAPAMPATADLPPLPGPDDPADVAIVGGGPIGLELAIGLRAADLRTVQLEAGPIGATIAWWAPGTRFFSSPERIAIAGVPIPSPDQSKATREDYLAYLRAVVAQHRLPVHAWRRVTRIDGDAARGFRLTVERSDHGVGGPAEWARLRAFGDDAPAGGPAAGPAAATGRGSGPARNGAAVTGAVGLASAGLVDGDGSGSAGDAAAAPAEHAHARRVVLAIGDMHRPNRLGIDGEDAGHVSHWFGEPHEFLGRRVLVVGGRNSAVEAALRLYRAGVPVAISYRGEAFDPTSVKYWLRPEIEWLIDRGRIGWHPRTVPVAIGSDHIVLAPVDGAGRPRHDARATTRVPADRVLLLTGYRQDPTLFEQLGVELVGEDRAPRFDRATQETNVPGVHVAGTACGGSQRRTRFYIENTHVHVDRILRAITGRADVDVSDPDFAALEES